MRQSDSNIIAIIHCVKNGWLSQLLRLPVNIWMREEAHYPQCVFSKSETLHSGSNGNITMNVFWEKFSKVTTARPHLLDAISNYLISLRAFVKALRTLWALFILVNAVAILFLFYSLDRHRVLENAQPHESAIQILCVCVIWCVELFVWMRAVNWTHSRHVRTDGRQIWQHLSRGGLSWSTRCNLIWCDYSWCLPYTVLHRCHLPFKLFMHGPGRLSSSRPYYLGEIHMCADWI